MNQNQFTEEHLIVVIRRDCLRLAQTAQAKLSEVVECLGDENHLGALGSFANLDEDVVCRKGARELGLRDEVRGERDRT